MILDLNHLDERGGHLLRFFCLKNRSFYNSYTTFYPKMDSKS